MEWRWWIKYRLLKPWLLWKDLYWGFLHRTFKRFNKVELTHVKPGYYDVDHRMLHACFTLLESFVEKEKPFEHIDWDHDEEHQHIASEIKSLYNWWKESYLCREGIMETFPDNLRPKDLEDWKKTPDGGASYGPDERESSEKKWPEYHLSLRESWEQEERWHKEETDNLIRLMRIRPYLWT
jgi:hypothetical protein